MVRAWLSVFALVFAWVVGNQLVRSCGEVCERPTGPCTLECDSPFALPIFLLIAVPGIALAYLFGMYAERAVLEKAQVRNRTPRMFGIGIVYTLLYLGALLGALMAVLWFVA